jgi:hypothetical protein
MAIPQQSSRVAISSFIAGVAVVAVAAGAISWLFFASAPHARFESSSPVAGVTAGTIRIDDAAERVTISAADLGSSLYRLNIDYLYSRPNFSDAGGNLRINRDSNLVNFWGRPRDVIELTVSRSVLWTVVIDGAGSTINLDLTAGRLLSFTFNGAGSNATLAAGAPQGVVTVNLSGVGSRLSLALPPNTQFRATADGVGAFVDGNAQTDDWSTAQDRYDVSASGVGVHATVTSGSVL